MGRRGGGGGGTVDIIEFTKKKKKDWNCRDDGHQRPKIQKEKQASDLTEKETARVTRKGTRKAVNRSATPGGAKGSCAPDDRTRSGKMMTSDLRRTGSASVSRQPKEQLEGREGR